MTSLLRRSILTSLCVLAIACGAESTTLDGGEPGDGGPGGMDGAASDGGLPSDDGGLPGDGATGDDGGLPGDDGGLPGDDGGTVADDAGPAPDGGGVITRDGGPRRDGGAVITRDAGADGGGAVGRDAGPVCGGNMPGTCSEPGTMCLSCPAGGPASNYLCTTRCTRDDECPASRPTCNRPMFGPGGSREGICTPAGFTCAWGSVCASPDTPIATPSGEQPISALREGDLVLSLHEGELVPRPIRYTGSTEVRDHAVVRVVLATERVLEISAGHPTADLRFFGDLVAGERLDGVEILEVSMVPYRHARTYDILPESDTGTYVAGGVLIGSTLQ